MLDRNCREENRLSWNAGIEARKSHRGDKAQFFREGENTLHQEEKELVGDIAAFL
jgi:hypothetical protein